ncbi:MAG TPA: AMP-binding protein [Stellaceae bacterium]|nr:AMP-binding protein [Stellaceae bacterium]
MSILDATAATRRPWEKFYPPGVDWHAPIRTQPLTRLVDQAVARFADHPFLDFPGLAWRYREFGVLIDRVARRLADLGVGPGVGVGLYLPNVPHFPVAFFAVLKAGGRVVNMSPLDADRELRHKVIDSEIRLAITLAADPLYPKLAAQLGAGGLGRIVVGTPDDFGAPDPRTSAAYARLGGALPIVDDPRHVRFADLLRPSMTALPPDPPTDEVALLQYTGGTTGVPKAAMLTHANLSAAVEMYDLWNRGNDVGMMPGRERVMLVLPLFHIYALTTLLLRGTHNGYCLILRPRFDVDDILADIATVRPTQFSGVPTMFRAIANHPRAATVDFSSLKICNTGGAPLPAELREPFERLSGRMLAEGWGMTETAPAGANSPVNASRRPGATGLPLPGVDIEIRDLDDPARRLPAGEKGEICVRGKNVMKGYWKQPEATSEAFHDGFLRTGDIGYLDTDGFLFLVDRKKDMILSGGYNVYPRMIEEAIYEHPGVLEVIVIGIADDYRGQSAKAFVTLRAGAAPFSLETLRGFLADKLGRHELPTVLEFRDALPKTAVGKLSKKILMEEERPRQS